MGGAPIAVKADPDPIPHGAPVQCEATLYVLARNWTRGIMGLMRFVAPASARIASWILAAACLGACGPSSTTDAPESLAGGFVSGALSIQGDGASVALEPVSRSAGSWRLAIGVSGVGRHGAVVAVGSGEVTCAEESCTAGRTGGVTERFVSAPRGIEHVVEIARRPDGEGELEVELGLDGADALERDAHGLTLRLRGSTTLLTYTELAVHDADGRELPATMSPRGAGIAISVDDDAARYPIVIDPLVMVSVDQLDVSGLAIDISGDTAVVSGTFDDLPGVSHAGQAHVFVENAGVWTLQQSLSAADPTVDSFFGISVAVSGDTIAVGCPHCFDDSGTPDVGAVYVFTRTGTTWTQQAKLFEDEGGPLKSYGYSLALAGDMLAVGARWDDFSGLENAGAVYVYDRVGTTWSRTQKITASDAANYDTFGFSLSLDGNTLAVGAYLHDTAPTPDAGAVYVYTRSAGVFTEQARLVEATTATLDQVGYAVALEGNTLFAGAPGIDRGGVTDRGGAYVFTRSGTVWSEAGLLTASDFVDGDGFGDALDVDNGMLLAGASAADVGALTDAGAVYVFTGAGPTWVERTKGQPAVPSADTLFGYALSLRGSTALVGAPSPTVVPTRFTHVLHIGLEDGDPCSSPTECLSGFCVDSVCCVSACGGNATDDCRACSVAAGATVDGQCRRLALGTTCRAATGPCDVAEVCDGATNACPGDTFASASLECRAAAGGCDVAEHCPGTGPACPADALVGASVVCRAPAGTCDVAEACTGTDAACPADGFMASSAVCRPPAGACDVAETCTGTGPACPPNVLVAASVVCRPPAGACDVAEACTGTAAACPADAFMPSSVTCRPSAGGCDVDEACTGSGAACPPDVLVGAAVVCRSSAGACDLDEVCTGTDAACPADLLVPATVVCRPSAGLCDVAETCTGGDPTCPPDALMSASVVCRAAAGACDVDEACTGTDAACPADGFMPSTVVCRAATGVCDPEEACTGGDADCPSDAFAPDGTPCADGVGCNGDELCATGACAAGTPPLCEDTDVCTTDACEEPGTCSFTPIAGCCVEDAECDDGDLCTTDACVTNACESTEIEGCCRTADDCDDGDACTDDACESNECVHDSSSSCTDAGMPDGGVASADGGELYDGAASGDGAVDDGGDDAGMGTGEGGGCGCRVAARSGRPSILWLGLVLGVAVLARRRPR